MPCSSGWFFSGTDLGLADGWGQMPFLGLPGFPSKSGAAVDDKYEAPPFLTERGESLRKEGSLILRRRTDVS